MQKLQQPNQVDRVFYTYCISHFVYSCIFHYRIPPKNVQHSELVDICL